MSLLPQNARPGQLEPRGEIRTESRNEAVNDAAFARGDVLSNVASKWQKAAAADKAPFAVCLKDKATTDTRVEYVDQVGVEISVTADGAITPQNFVKAGTAAGRVIAHVAGTDADNLIVGRYIKRAKWVPEGDGVTAAPSAAQNDIIIIRLGKQ
jgi:hypothetical protein